VFQCWKQGSHRQRSF